MAVSGDVGGLQERAAEAAVRLVVDDPRLLDVVAQPIVDLTDGRPAGFELLARVPADWRCRRTGCSPRPGASGCPPGSRPPSTRRAWSCWPGCPAAASSPSTSTRPTSPSPTWSPRSSTCPSSRPLVVEVTERVWPERSGPAEDALSSLRDRGALLAVDDVGAGFAGLTQISRLRPEMVKLDQALVADLGTDPAAELVVDALGRLCGQLDAWVVAEGIERPDQLSVLVRLGVPLGQGFLLGRGEQPWPAVHGAAPRARRAGRGADCGDDGAARRQPGPRRGRRPAWERDATGAYRRADGDRDAPGDDHGADHAGRRRAAPRRGPPARGPVGAGPRHRRQPARPWARSAWRRLVTAALAPGAVRPRPFRPAAQAGPAAAGGHARGAASPSSRSRLTPAVGVDVEADVGDRGDLVEVVAQPEPVDGVRQQRGQRQQLDGGRAVPGRRPSPRPGVDPAQPGRARARCRRTAWCRPRAPAARPARRGRRRPTRGPATRRRAVSQPPPTVVATPGMSRFDGEE